MSLIFVSAIYELREGYFPKESYLDKLLGNFGRLLETLPAEISFFVWTDLPELQTRFQRPRLHFLHAKLRDFSSFRQIMDRGHKLPELRNQKKDTQEFMALMNAKLEMIMKSIPFWSMSSYPKEPSHAAWIDAGIWKIFQDHQLVKNSLADLVGRSWAPYKGIHLAGCWERGVGRTKDRICWRFCGGFFIIHKTDLVNGIWPLFLKVLNEEYLAHGHIAWEVNVWADMEARDPALFHWFLGGHEETILKIPYV